MLGELGQDHALREARRWVGRLEGVVGVLPSRRTAGALEVWVAEGADTDGIPASCDGVPVVVRVARGLWSFSAEVPGPRP